MNNTTDNDNYYDWVKDCNLLSEVEQSEKVYMGRFTPVEPYSKGGSVECVDEFMTRMIEIYRPYENSEMWIVDDEDMFTERGIFYSGYEEWDFDQILDCDKMGAEVLKIIEDMKGS